MLETRIREHPCVGMEFPCVVCGVWFEQNRVAVSLVDVVAVEFEDEHVLGDVCPECLKNGVETASERLELRMSRTFKLLGELTELKLELNKVESWVTVGQLKQVEDELEQEIMGEMS